MQRFVLLTVAFTLWLGGLAATLPRGGEYVEAEDLWMPERFTDLEEATWEVGYHIPSLHNAPGWRLEGIFVAWRGDQGLVDVTYVSDSNARLTLSINRRRERAPFIKDKDEREASTQERVRFAGRYAQLLTYRTSTVQVMTTVWTRNGMPIRATAFVFADRDGRMTLTKQHLLEALETVH